jgi:hypothetical protein
MNTSPLVVNLRIYSSEKLFQTVKCFRPTCQNKVPKRYEGKLCNSCIHWPECRNKLNPVPCLSGKLCEGHSRFCPTCEDIITASEYKHQKGIIADKCFLESVPIDSSNDMQEVSLFSLFIFYIYDNI